MVCGEVNARLQMSADLNNVKDKSPIAGHILIATLLLFLEVCVGIGMVGMSVGFFVAGIAFLRAVKWKDLRRHLLRVSAVYVLLFVGTAVAIAWNSSLARKRAEPVIAAVERFRADHGRYPGTLNELVPAYLSSIPRGGFTWISRQYWYDARRPQVYFAAMFHGVFFYDFPTHQWLSNE